ncbi:hypothetical protein RRG08_021128 [Elysia crispata]|uniref:Uncharacterized protein n=1 Tax=Elysia crispata TaxID=231223 RepID=A0AAE1DB13_9GAST|nr:hypothetical protein RRG08_021128 [Elysia crispata]
MHVFYRDSPSSHIDPNRAVRRNHFYFTYLSLSQRGSVSHGTSLLSSRSESQCPLLGSTVNIGPWGQD